MRKRKPISKKTRFEVFKRDGFQCQYCGQTPPSVTLEIDHINPVSKGGKNQINNLITSCFDCNRGKSNVELNRIPNTLQENKEILEERENQYIEYHKILAKIDKRVNKETGKVNEIFKEYFPEHELTNSFRKNSVKKFIESLNIFEVIDSMEIACEKFKNSKAQFVNGQWMHKEDLTTKYFCGICWNKIKGKDKL